MENTQNLISGGSPLKKIGQFKLFIQMIKSHMNKSYTGMASWVIPVLVLTIIYVISPIDIIPDVPFVGWIDDAAIVAMVYKFISKEISKFDEWRKTNITIN